MSDRVISLTDRNTGEHFEQLPWRADIQYVDASTFGMVRFHSRRPRIPPPPPRPVVNPLLALDDDDVVGRFPALQSALSIVENQMHAKGIHINNVDAVRAQYAALYGDVEDTDPVHWAVWTWTKRQLLARLTRPLQLTMDDLFPRRRDQPDLGPNASGDTQWYSAVLLDTPNAEPVVRTCNPWHVIHNARDRPATLHNNASEVAGQPDPLRDFGIKIQQWPGVGPVGHVYACCHQPMGSPGCLIGYPEPKDSTTINSKNTLYQWFGGQRVSVENRAYRGLAFKERSRFDVLHEKIVARLTDTLILELQNRGITKSTPNDIIAVLMEVAELMYQYNKPLCGAGYLRPYPMERSAFIRYMESVLRLDDDPIVAAVAVTENPNTQLWRVVTTGTQKERDLLSAQYDSQFIDALVQYAPVHEDVLRDYVLRLPLSREQQWDKWTKEIAVLVGAMKEVPMQWFENYPESVVFLNTLKSPMEQEVVKRISLATRQEKIQLTKRDQSISTWLAFFFVKDVQDVDAITNDEYKRYVEQVLRLRNAGDAMTDQQQAAVKQDRALKFFLDYIPRERFFDPSIDNERLQSSRRKMSDFVRADLRADLQELRDFIATRDYENIKRMWSNIIVIDLSEINWDEKDAYKQLLAEAWDVPDAMPVNYFVFQDKFFKIIQYLECVADREKKYKTDICSTVPQLRRALSKGKGVATSSSSSSSVVSDAERMIDELKEIIVKYEKDRPNLTAKTKAWFVTWNEYVMNTLMSPQQKQYYDNVAAYTRYDEAEYLVFENRLDVDPATWEQYYESDEVKAFLATGPVILYKSNWFVPVATLHADTMRQAFDSAKTSLGTDVILQTLKQQTNTIIAQNRTATFNL